jgi:hypothetical protein
MVLAQLEKKSQSGKGVSKKTGAGSVVGAGEELEDDFQDEESGSDASVSVACAPPH